MTSQLNPSDPTLQILYSQMCSLHLYLGNIAADFSLSNNVEFQGSNLGTSHQFHHQHGQTHHTLLCSMKQYYELPVPTSPPHAFVPHFHLLTTTLML
uniref:Uncharacterized protein n=1 Tax=Octopus bimaculoides TaxID=37653 RepID=A0A0L8HG12_OCTBM